MKIAVRCEALDTLDRYLRVFPQERAQLQLLKDQLVDNREDCFVRSNMRGHITTSILVLSPDLSHVLMIHHKLFNRWLPPGGHYEDSGSLWDSGLREVTEETGVADVLPHAWTRTHRIPLNINSHRVIPNPRKNEGAHRHHDFRFLGVAQTMSIPTLQLEEVNDARWISIDEFNKFTEGDNQFLLGKLMQVLELKAA